MNRRMPSLNALRAFEATARHGSLTRAAGELHVTPAAVSHQLKALEEDLGIKLMRRVGQELILSEAAQAGLPSLRQGFRALAEGVRLLREDPSHHYLTVSVPPTLAATWLVPRLDRFKRQETDIDVRLEASDEMVNFLHDGVDMAIRFGGGDYPGLHATRLFGEQVYPVCSPELLDGDHGLTNLQNLKHHTLLHVEWQAARDEPPSWEMWLRAAGVDDVDATRGPRFSHGAMSLQAAAQGHGVALGSSALVADALKAGRLVKPFDLTIDYEFTYFVVSPQETAEDPKIKAFRRWLLAEALQSS